MPARKRQYGEGGISEYRTKSGVRYRARWMEPVSRTDPDGVRREREKAGFRTKTEAADHLLEVRVAVKRGVPLVTQSDGPTLAEHMVPWLDGHRGAASTVAGYRKLYRLHIEPLIGPKHLGQIRPVHLAALYRQLEAGRPEEERPPLGPNTVRKVHDLLSIAFEAAIEEGLLAVNPARNKAAKPPRGREVKAAKPQIEIWDAETLTAFLTWAREDDADMHPVWVVAAATGMRRGELLGLQWGDIDLSAGYIHVQRAVTAIKVKGQPGYIHTGPTKNGKPRRIDIDPTAIAVLRALRLSRASESLTSTAADQPAFLLRSGRTVHPDRLTKRWSQAVERFRRVRPSATALHLHGVRHTHASLLLAGGMQLKVVQERLGHDAPSEVIAAAYRALSKQLHPDRPGGDAEKFALVNAANDVLRSSESRAAYDASLARAATPETEAEPESDDAPWGDEVDLEEVIEAPVVHVSAPTTYEPMLFESDESFPVWAVRTLAGRTWLIGLIASIGLAVAASQVMRDKGAPLINLPEIAPGNIFIMLILGIAIGSVLLVRRAAGTAMFLSIGTFWFWNQGNWAWAPDARWAWTAVCLVASFIAAHVSTSALLQRD